MPLHKVAIDTSNLIHCGKPVAVAGEKAAKGCLWPTGDGLYWLTSYPKPVAQGAATKVGFAVLYSQITMPGFGYKPHS